jgi:hypothetical protein
MWEFVELLEPVGLGDGSGAGEHQSIAPSRIPTRISKKGYIETG